MRISDSDTIIITVTGQQSQGRLRKTLRVTSSDIGLEFIVIKYKIIYSIPITQLP